MTVRELIRKLFEYPYDCEVCSTTKDEVTFVVVEPNGTTTYLIALPGRMDLVEKEPANGLLLDEYGHWKPWDTRKK